MISSIVSRLVILVFGTLYPAYASYKAVRTKNVKEYVKWMMYWIVFALFTCAETFTDVFLSFWFPFYYEIKIILVLWLLSPATKGSSILYRKFVHPMLSRREQEIDEYIAKAKEQGYHTVLHLGTKGVNYATTVLMQTAIKGGGGLVNQLRRSYSLSDLSSDKDSDMTRSNNVPDEDDMEETDGLDPRMLRPRGYSPRRSASGSGRVEMYFPEVDVDVRQHGTSRPREPSIPLSHIRSSEDVSSGYSSAEPLYAGHHTTKSEGLATSREPLVRTASVGSTRSMRTKTSRGGMVTKRVPAVEDSDFFEPQSDETVHFLREDYFYAKSPSYFPPSIPNNASSTQEQFVDASEEDLPLFDAQSNDLSLSESVTHETPSSKDLTISVSESTHPFTLSSEAGGTQSQNKEDINNLTQLAEIISDVKSNNVTCSEVVQLNPVAAHATHTVSTLAEKQSPVTLLPIEESSLIEKKLPTTEPSLVEKKLPTTEPSLVEKKLPTVESSLAEKKLPTTEPSLVEKKLPTTELSLAEKKLPTTELSLVEKKLPTVEPSLVEKKLPSTEPSLVETEVSITKSPAAVALLSDNTKHKENILTGDSSLLEKEQDESQSKMKSPVNNYKADENINVTHPAEATSPLSVSSPEILKININESETGKLNESGLTDSSETAKLNESGLADSIETAKLNQSGLADSSETSKLKKSGLTDSIEAAKLNQIGLAVSSETAKLNESGLTDSIETAKLNQNGLTDSSETAKLNQSELTDSSETAKLNESGLTDSNETAKLNQNGIVDSNETAKLNESGSAYESSDSLAVLDTSSRSNSQTSLRKEGRSGRYNKHPAPTPPSTTPEPEDRQPVTPTLDKKEMSEDTATGSDDSEAAITTARLVLKPGVVRSVGPDTNTKTEVFVSKTPLAKNKKSKSKQKQADSGMSRLFAIPKNQFGSLTSLLPFWHGKQEPSSVEESSSSQQLKAPLADYE